MDFGKGESQAEAVTFSPSVIWFISIFRRQAADSSS
jgi:hypothetical protein